MFLSPPVLLKNLAMCEALISSRLDPYIQSSHMMNVEACSLFPIVELPLQNVKQILAFLSYVSQLISFSKIYIQNPTATAKLGCEVHEPSTIQLRTWDSQMLCSCEVGLVISFALCDVWHSISTYLTSSKGSLLIRISINPSKLFIKPSFPYIPDYLRIKISF